MQRVLRRFPPLRWIAYRQALLYRIDRRESQWKYTQTVLMAVGQMTISWAGIERMLDELIAWYQHHFTALEKEHPRSLSNKLKYLRLMQCDQRMPDKMREFFRETRIEAKRLGNERHEVIHGLLHHRGGPTSLQWRTQRIIYDGPYARLSLRDYHGNDLADIGAGIAALSQRISPKIWIITQDDYRHMTVSDVEKTRSELGLS